MTVYGSSRDQSPWPDEPRPPSGPEPSPWSPDSAGTGTWRDPPQGPAGAAGLGFPPRDPYGDRGAGDVHRDQPTGAYGDQGTRNVYGTPDAPGADGTYGGQSGSGVGRAAGGAYGAFGRGGAYGGRVQAYSPEDLPSTGRLGADVPTSGAPEPPRSTGSGWQELTGPGNVPPPSGPPGSKAKTPRVTGARRTAIIVGAVAALVVGAGTAAAATFLRGNSASSAGAGASGGPSSTPASKGVAGGSPSAVPGGAPVGPADGITLSATGDVVMGMAPTGLPPNSGKGFFDPVKTALTADLEMGNLEQTITDDTGVGKCSAASAGKTCFAFRTPPAFAQNLKDAGFGLMNEANNHAYDFGPAGYQNTRHNLDSVGIKYTGWPGEIPVVDVKGVKVAVIGFASYTWSNLCSDLPNATTLIKQAKTKADLVVIQVHQGGEGSDKTHVKPGTEMFLGENRCDPIAFAHNAIDAGADLVVGHGPHVMRAMEFYKGHLIAYSMGNFAGYHALTVNGVLAVGGVLKVTLLGDGTFKGATLVSTKMVSPGWPRPDPQKQAITLVGGLSKSDFPTTGAKIAADGTITPP